jgi:hypothetical protein
MRALAKNLSLALGATVFALLTFELALRAQEPFLHLVANHFSLPLFFASHPIWDHWRTPHIRIVVPMVPADRYPEPAVYEYNDQGLRDPRDVSLPKPPGVRRVFVMGDSFTEGSYYANTMAVVLERALRRAAPDRGYEVFNAGCLSYSPLLYYLRFKHQLLGLQPDAVVVNVDLTDVYDDNYRYAPKCIWATDGEPERIYQPRARRIKTFIKDKLYLGRVAASILIRLQAPRVVPYHDDPVMHEAFSYFSTLPIDSPRWQKDVDFLLTNLARLIALCRESGIELVITTVPHREQIVPDAQGRLWNRELERRIEALCAREGVAYYSPFEGIARAVRAGEPLYILDEFHFTPEGQQLWSGLVSAFLVDRWTQTTGVASSAE